MPIDGFSPAKDWLGGTGGTGCKGPSGPAPTVTLRITVSLTHFFSSRGRLTSVLRWRECRPKNGARQAGSRFHFVFYKLYTLGYIRFTRKQSDKLLAASL